MTEDPLEDIAKGERDKRANKDSPASTEPHSWDRPPSVPGVKNLVGMTVWQKWIADCEKEDARKLQERWEKKYGKR